MGELERARLGQVGLAQQSGFDTALKAFQNQQLQQLQAAQGLGSLGSMQAGLGASTQTLGLGDINTLLGLGGIGQQQAQKEIEEIEKVIKPLYNTKMYWFIKRCLEPNINKRELLLI